MYKWTFRNGCMTDTVVRNTITEAWAAMCKRWPGSWSCFYLESKAPAFEVARLALD